MGILREIEEAGGLGQRVLHYRESTPSTNTLALALGREGAPAGTVVLAESQSQGRGRLGKSWLSPPAGGLYFSLILRSRLAPEELARITLVAGLGACLALEEHTGLRPRLTWPNDLLLAGKKGGGILAECGWSGQTPTTLVVLGVGLNVATPLAAFPAELQGKATSLLLASGREYSRGALLPVLLRHLERVLARLEEGEFPTLLAAWRERDAHLHATLRWLTPDGQVVAGRSLGPDESGLLHIQDQEGIIHPVLSGDLELLAPRGESGRGCDAPPPPAPNNAAP